MFATREPDTEHSIFTGSHLDSVFNCGYLDGALGVITELDAIDAVYESDLEPAYHQADSQSGDIEHDIYECDPICVDGEAPALADIGVRNHRRSRVEL